LIGADESFVFMDAFCPSGAQVARQYFIERMDGWMDGWMVTHVYHSDCQRPIKFRINSWRVDCNKDLWNFMGAD
jgi:hypothetical protein